MHRYLLQARCDETVRNLTMHYEAAVMHDSQEPLLERPRLWYKVPGTDLTQVYECAFPKPVLPVCLRRALCAAVENGSCGGLQRCSRDSGVTVCTGCALSVPATVDVELPCVSQVRAFRAAMLLLLLCLPRMVD